MRLHERGMTLIELLTVMMVIGILTAIAVPSYRSYLLRSQRSDAKTALLQVQAAQERFYLQANKYTDNVSAAMPTGLGLSGTSSNGYYNIVVDAGANQTYTVRATPIAGKGQSDDTKCTELSITDTGLRGAKGPGGLDFCWR